MSHFVVTVVLPPTAPDLIEEAIATALQPFHEFECTGTNDQYVQDIDETEDLRHDFATKRRKLVRLADGTEVDRHDAVCYREPTAEELAKVGGMGGSGGGHGLSWYSTDWKDGRGYRPKVHEIPIGAEEFELPWPSLVDFYRDYHDGKTVPEGSELDLDGEHKFGYALTDENGNLVKVVRRTNPNRKWDWWVIGGRWTGFLSCNDPAKDMRNYETCYLCHGTGKRQDDLGRQHRESNPDYTCNGCDGKGMALKHPTKWLRDEGDIRTKREINFDEIRDRAEVRAATLYDAVHQVVAGRHIPDWDEMHAAFGTDLEGAREAYHADPVVKDIRASENSDLRFLGDLSRFRVAREEYLATARKGATATFAVLHEGQWYERGEMGWWGSVSNEKDGNQWAEEFDKLIDGLPDDAVLAIVDCHI